MRFLLPALGILLSVAAGGQTPGFYQENYRPQYHFTPPIHWMNDPNGLVMHKGNFHLFYQFNPFGNRWGHMSWGHAVSRDLVHWEHWPLAIPEEKDTMIFSGSCVVDEYNTAEFAEKPGQAPMVAIYTAHIEGKNQSQHLAYSLDEGRTWKKYNRNPVLDLGRKDFRDPSVIWYAPQRKWVMTVAVPDEHKVQFYASANLKDWKLLSSFGPAGDTTGIWECPSLFQAPVRGDKGKKKWVLMLSPAPYMQYFVGEFDGEKFINENNPAQTQRPDYGPDYYAAIPFNGIPSGFMPVSIGWVNNWNYANDIPTTPWKSAMSLPRELSLQKEGANWILLQEPSAAVGKLKRTSLYTAKQVEVNGQRNLPVQSQQCLILLQIEPGKGTVSGLRVAAEGDKYIEIGYDRDAGKLYLDRRNSGETDFNANFGKLFHYEVPLQPVNGKISLVVFLDKSIVEVFGNDGRVAMTAQAFPYAAQKGVRIFSENGKSIFRDLSVQAMPSVWLQAQ